MKIFKVTVTVETDQETVTTSFTGRKKAFRRASAWLLTMWRVIRDAEILSAPPRKVSDSLPEFRVNRGGIKYDV